MSYTILEIGNLNGKRNDFQELPLRDIFLKSHTWGELVLLGFYLRK